MCSGTALLYKIPCVIVGENRNFKSPGEKWLQERNVSIHLEQDEECISLMSEFIAKNPSLWQEDIHDLFLEK
jgi:cytosine deaminase